MSDFIYKSLDYIVKWLPRAPAPKEIEKIIIKEVETMLRPSGQNFVRLAGLSGAIAVMLGAYGAHVFKQSEAEDRMKHTFETGNRYHFIHTLALMAIPMTRKPHLVGILMLSGMTLFSGSCYVHALTGNDVVRRVTPYGGMLLIAAWGAMIL